MMNINFAKPVASGLLVIRLSRPFAAKSAANRVMKRWFYMAMGNCIHVFWPYFGPHQYSVNQLWLYDVFTAKTTV